MARARRASSFDHKIHRFVMMSVWFWFLEPESGRLLNERGGRGFERVHANEVALQHEIALPEQPTHPQRLRHRGRSRERLAVSRAPL